MNLSFKNPERIPKESQKNPEKIPKKSQKNHKRIPKESQKNPERIPKESLSCCSNLLVRNSPEETRKTRKKSFIAIIINCVL